MTEDVGKTPEKKPAKQKGNFPGHLIINVHDMLTAATYPTLIINPKLFAFTMADFFT